MRALRFGDSTHSPHLCKFLENSTDGSFHFRIIPVSFAICYWVKNPESKNQISTLFRAQNLLFFNSPVALHPSKNHLCPHFEVKQHPEHRIISNPRFTVSFTQLPRNLPLVLHFAALLSLRSNITKIMLIKRISIERDTHLDLLRKRKRLCARDSAQEYRFDASAHARTNY